MGRHGDGNGNGLISPRIGPWNPTIGTHITQIEASTVFFFLLFSVSRLIHNDRKCRLIVYLLIPHIIHTSPSPSSALGSYLLLWLTLIFGLYVGTCARFFLFFDILVRSICLDSYLSTVCITIGCHNVKRRNCRRLAYHLRMRDPAGF